MSRQQFSSRNNIGQVLTFQKSGATASFDPSIGFSSGSKRVSWRIDNGLETTQIAGNSLSYTGFTSDTNIRTVQMRGNSFKNTTFFNFQNKNLYGEINLSNLKELKPWPPVGGTSITLQNNLNLTGITNPTSTETIWGYDVGITGLYNLDLTPFSGGLIKNLNTHNCPNLSGITLGQNLSITESFGGYNSNLTGNLDLTPLSGFGGQFQVQNNPLLTGITNPSSSEIFNLYTAYDCNLTGNLDLTPLSGLGGGLQVNNNPNLTGITHSPSSQNFSIYYAYNCNLTGNLDLTPLSGLGGIFLVLGNPNLTSITHSPSPNNFNDYFASNCNLIGNLDLTPLSGLGGNFEVSNNINLTGITHSPSPNTFLGYNASNCNLTGNLDLTPLSGLGSGLILNNNPLLTGISHSPSQNEFSSYWVYNCGLIGNLDLTPLSGLGGQFLAYNNTSLTGITHSLSTNNFSQYEVGNCNLTGNLDLSMLYKLGGEITGLTGSIDVSLNQYLTGITLPNSTQVFKNKSNTISGALFNFSNNNLEYVNFKSLSGATLLTGDTVGNPRIELQDNTISTTDVNHILVDFSGNATYNPTGWSNINLNISGANGAPDSGSGGYNGIAAINFLTGSPYNWTITYT